MMTSNVRRTAVRSCAAVAVAALLAGAGPTSVDPLADDMKANGIALGQALADRDLLSDPAKRAAAAPTLVPLLTRERSLLDQFGAAHPSVAASLASRQQQTQAMLYLLGDKPTVDATDAAARSSPDSADGVTARAVQLHARWLGAGPNAAAQQTVADDLVKLDAAHATDPGLTTLTYTLSRSAVSPDLKAKLVDVATNQMHNPAAARAKETAAMQKEFDAAAEHMKSLEGKPLTLSGTTVDGKPFSTDRYKGKVVLVDFWATWCEPCKADLPRLQATYARYHGQGLEIVGVSNDFTADRLRTYTAQNEMPWVELFDPAAAADHQWNPTTMAVGIRAIPTMFLIDKSGVLRTVDARQNLERAVPSLLAE